jgi:hypothetical protein
VLSYNSSSCFEIIGGYDNSEGWSSFSKVGCSDNKSSPVLSNCETGVEFTILWPSGNSSLLFFVETWIC